MIKSQSKQVRVLNGIEYQAEFGNTHITKLLAIKTPKLSDMNITVFSNNVQVAKYGDSIITMGESPDRISTMYRCIRSQTVTFTKPQKGQKGGLVFRKVREQDKLEPSTQTNWGLWNGMVIEEDVKSGAFSQIGTTDRWDWLSKTK